jgi:hypothetical protein
MSVGTIKLTVGLGESVVVEAAANRVNTEETQHAGLITASQIAQIQTKGRDVTSLMRLVPACATRTRWNRWGRASAPLVPQVSGMRRDWNHITVDGVLGQRGGPGQPDGPEHQPGRGLGDPRPPQHVPRRVTGARAAPTSRS